VLRIRCIRESWRFSCKHKIRSLGRAIAPLDVRYLKRTVKDENDRAGAEGPQRSCSARLSNAAYPERASLFNGTRTGRANLADSSLNNPDRVFGTHSRSKHASLKRNGLGQIKNAVSISERPASIEDRAVPGHWEGDLIGGSRNSYVATLVERHSRYVMLVKIANKHTESVVSALIKQSTQRDRKAAQ